MNADKPPARAPRPRGAKSDPKITTLRDSAIAGAVEQWFGGAARDLPWRLPSSGTPGWRRDPYRALVSEAMLQQTQVSRVIPKFEEFIACFPTIESLASADESRVLALWSGLGYYRRARHLLASARIIVERHLGRFPTEVASLRALPGIGPYTAGSIASIAMGRREPLVDGNAARVLLRVEGREGNIGEASTSAWAWSRAAMLVGAATDPGAFNEGLMELGATVCSPLKPACSACPLTELCRTKKSGRQGEIPSPKKRAERRVLFCASALIHDHRGRIAVEQRGAGAMWAWMWQVPTLERDDRAPTAPELAAHILGPGAGPARSAREMEPLRTLRHGTTHRDVVFDLWRCCAPDRVDIRGWRGRWVRPADLDDLGLSSIQRRILDFAFDAPG